MICVLHPITWPIQLCGDNQGSLALVRNPLAHHRTKHIDLRDRFITDLVSKRIIQVAYIHTSQMLADGFTRCLSKDRHAEFVSNIGLFHRTVSCGESKQIPDLVGKRGPDSTQADASAGNKRRLPSVFWRMWDRGE